MPASWLTSSGWPDRLSTSTLGGPAEASTATLPDTTRTRRAAAPSNSSSFGASMTQRGTCPSLPGQTISLNPAVKMYRVQRTWRSHLTRHCRVLAPSASPAPYWAAPCRAGPHWAGPHGLVLVQVQPGQFVVVQPGQPAGQPVHRRLGLRREVHELAHPLGQPAQRDLVRAAPVGQLLDALVGVVHG